MTTITRLVACLSLCALSGCISVVPRNHATGLVDELGLEAVQNELVEVSTRARDPQITDVEFKDVGFTFQYTAPAWGWYGAVGQGRISVVYNNLGRLDLYENSKVFVVTSAEHVQAQILFQSMADAERWCDLVSSLWANHKNQ